MLTIAETNSCHEHGGVADDHMFSEVTDDVETTASTKSNIPDENNAKVYSRTNSNVSEDSVYFSGEASTSDKVVETSVDKSYGRTNSNESGSSSEDSIFYCGKANISDKVVETSVVKTYDRTISNISDYVDVAYFSDEASSIISDKLFERNASVVSDFEAVDTDVPDIRSITNARSVYDRVNSIDVSDYVNVESFSDETNIYEKIVEAVTAETVGRSISSSVNLADSKNVANFLDKATFPGEVSDGTHTKVYNKSNSIDVSDYVNIANFSYKASTSSKMAEASKPPEEHYRTISLDISDFVNLPEIFDIANIPEKTETNSINFNRLDSVGVSDFVQVKSLQMDDNSIQATSETRKIQVYNKTKDVNRSDFVVVGDSSNSSSDTEARVIEEDHLSDSLMEVNTEELYSEVLYRTIHSVGSFNVNAEDLHQYLQKAFRLDPERHESLLHQVRTREAPSVQLHVQVVEAKELAAKDANGLSDPFCVLYLSSQPELRHSTTVKKKTLSPAWGEDFSFLLMDPKNDVLCLEVWDFDPMETLRQKLTQVTEVDGVKGMHKFMKEIAVTMTHTQQEKEFIGISFIQLKDVSTCGEMVTVTLKSKKKSKPQGTVKVKLAFSSEKKAHSAIEEYRHLLKVFALHNIESEKKDDKQCDWNGELPTEAECVLAQLLAQSSMAPLDEMLAQLEEYATMNHTHCLSFQVFSKLLHKLVGPISSGILTNDEVKRFWNAVKNVLPSCFNAIKTLRKIPPKETRTLNLIIDTLNILSMMSKLQLPADVDLFSANVYKHLAKTCPTQIRDIRSTLLDTINQAAIDWFKNICFKIKPKNSSEEAQLQQRTEIVDMSKKTLQNAAKLHDHLFQKSMGVSYAKILFTVFECKICELTEPTVKEVCDILKPINYQDRRTSGDSKDDPTALGTSLFQLYIALGEFSKLGREICQIEEENFHIAQFHLWFLNSVPHWLDISIYKSMQYIEKAVEKDELKAVDVYVKHSSSAVDARTIFNKITITWQKLIWPDAERSWNWLISIIEGVRLCSVHYANTLAARLKNTGERFKATKEWCLVINDLDYVSKSIQPFVNDLGIDDLIKKLGDLKDPAVIVNCTKTLHSATDDALESINNKMLDLLKTVARNISQECKKFVLKEADSMKIRMESLMEYLDTNLSALNSELNQENFERILTIIVENLSNIGYDLVHDGLEKKRPPAFFASLHKMLDMMKGFFRDGLSLDQQKSESLTRLERMLYFNGLNTTDLISQAHQHRLAEQRQIVADVNGMVTVRMLFFNNNLKIEVLNGRRLKPMDSNGFCDPFVTIHFLPAELFGKKKFTTKTQKKTLFPLFDEIFDIQVTQDQRLSKDALILFTMRDDDMFGIKSEFLGEAYYPVSEIPSTTTETNITDLEQIHLKLSKPSSTESDAINVLTHRKKDKLAQDFVKRQKLKDNPVLS